MASEFNRKVFRLSKARWEHAREYWRPQNDMYGRLMSFCLDMEHYLRNDGFTKDKRRIQPKTQKQLNLIRHKAALLLRKRPEFDGHAVQPFAGAKAAEISRRVIENIFLDPLKAYHDVRSRWVWSALAGGRGDIAIDWHPIHGVIFRFVDPRRIHITPGHTFMHSPLTPSVTEEVPMRMSELLRMKRSGWNIPRDINADDWKPDYASGSMRDDNLVDFSGGPSPNLPGADETEESDKIVTVVKTWYREDPFGDTRVVKKQADATLPPDEWYFVDDSTGERVPFDPMQPTPPTSEATGAPMRLVTSKHESYDPSENEKGYLCITAPFYAGEDGVLFEGSWLDGAINPNATLSAFPYMELTCYTNPLRRQGLSDTEATHSHVIIDNASNRATFEQMKQSGAIIAMEPGAFKDSEGNQFQVSDDPVAVAYAERVQLESMKFHQMPGMNPAQPAYRQMIAGEWQDIGSGDFSASLGPERSKDIAASTLSQLRETGDLPVQLHQQDIDLQESIGARVALDLSSAYMGDNVVSWVTDQGETNYVTVRGSDLVPLRVSVSAGKEWRQQDSDRVQAQAQFLGMVSKLGLPPNVLVSLLREAQFSDSVVTELSNAMQAPPPQMPGAVDSGSGGGPGAPDGAPNVPPPGNMQ